MYATFDFISGADLPGELGELPEWEDIIEEDCGLCFRLGADETGLCQHCRERVPRVGGCGKALALVTSVAGGGNDDAPLAHLIGCAGCRAFLTDLAEMSRAADLEANMQTPHAAGLAIAAA